jgi:hypothetical protein
MYSTFSKNSILFDEKRGSKNGYETTRLAGYKSTEHKTSVGTEQLFIHI